MLLYVAGIAKRYSIKVSQIMKRILVVIIVPYKKNIHCEVEHIRDGIYRVPAQ
mgnify:CR=1 FL=1